MNGIELLLHGNDQVETIPKGLVQGLHLSYFPTWLEFYKEDLRYEIDFPTRNDVERAFGGRDKSSIINKFKKEYAIAKKLKVKYMVYHVGHITTYDAFHFDFNYDNQAILDATAEIINTVFDDESDIELLFENLWWPGLTLLSNHEIEEFMSKINYPQKGIMLDLSHLLLTNPSLTCQEDAIDYIHQVLDNLGESTRWIEGMHINYTSGYKYMNKNHHELYEAYSQAKDERSKFSAIYKHISQMDEHLPFEHGDIKKIIERVNPKYQMIEVMGKDKDAWEERVKKQLEYM